MAYHASDPTLSTVRHYVDTSQPLMGLGDAASPDQTTIRIDYSGSHTVEPTIAPYAPDAVLSSIDAAQKSLITQAEWHIGPWVPYEGEIARSVTLNKLAAPGTATGMPLGLWMLAAVWGNLTGTPLFLLVAKMGEADVLYAVTLEEFKALPPNSYNTVALAGNSFCNATNLQSYGIIYKPSPGAMTGGGNVPLPSGGGTGTGWTWPTAFDPSAAAGPFSTWFGGGGASGSGSTPAPASSSGLGTVLVVGAVAAAAYYLMKPKYG